MNHRHCALWSALGAGATLAPAQASEAEHLQQNVFAQLPWRELGPVTFGGRIVDIAVHPEDPAVWWIAAASGGLWKTTNGGISFAPQFQDAWSISIGDLAVAPSQPDTLYVGTGEANNQRSSYWGNGVHKSTDGGATFVHVGLDGTDHIGRIVVHPRNPDVVFVAALGALYRANDERGLYRSRDGGSSWQRVHFVSADVGCVDVALDPGNPEVVYAAAYERRRRAWDLVEGGPGSRLWKSTDGGDSWQQLGGGLPAGDLGRIGLDVFAADPRILYASIENLNPQGPATAPAAETPADDDARRSDAPAAEVLADPVALADWQQRGEEEPGRARRRPIVGGEVWRSDDAGATWRKTNTRPIGGDPGYYYGQIRIAPDDAEHVFVLSVPVHESKDGGVTWTPEPRRRDRRRDDAPDGDTEPAPPRRAPFHGNLHVDHHALWIDPRDSRHCILGNDGGLAITWDGGARWDHIARLPIAQFYTIAVDLRSPYRVYGGLQDNGTWGFPIRAATTAGLRADDAFRIDGGDGFAVACDPEQPDIVWSESQFGGMSRQDLRTGERRSIRPRASKGSQPLRCNWMTPLVLSPHDPHVVYTGSQFVHRSPDRGDHWQTISGDLTTNDAQRKQGSVPHCTITTIAESPRRAGVLWVGTDDGKVWRSGDAGLHWLDLTERFPPAVQGLWVSRVEASPHDVATAFVAFTGYREDRREPWLFRTDDGGESFRPIHNDLPQEPINVVRQHPHSAHVLLVGTEMGAYVSIDDGAAWHRLGGGLPRVAVHDLVVHPREQHVLVATHGRGIWALDGRGLSAMDAALLQRPFAALPPSDGVVLPRAFSRGHQGARTWSVDNPFVTATFRFHLREDSDTAVQVEVLDAAGAVLHRREVEATAGYHEVAWRAADAAGPGGPPTGGRGQRAWQSQRPGWFAVRLRHGDETATLPFRVTDARGPRDQLGGVPGVGGDDTDAAAAPAVQHGDDDGESEAAEAGEDGQDGQDG